MVRHKNRYFVLEINQEDRKDNDSLIIKPHTLHTAILNKIEEMHGDFGLGAITDGFFAKYCNEKTRIAIVRNRHGPHRLVASVIPFIKTIDNKRVKINTLFVGATIKQCFKFILKYNQKKLFDVFQTLKTDEEKKREKEKYMELDKVLQIH